MTFNGIPSDEYMSGPKRFVKWSICDFCVSTIHDVLDLLLSMKFSFSHWTLLSPVNIVLLCPSIYCRQLQDSLR
jgi:hypothetical protein